MTSERELYWQLLRENPTGFIKIVRLDGEVIHAELLNASQDKDGSRHVVFDVLWSSPPEFYEAHRGSAFHLKLDEIGSVEPLSRDVGDEYLKRQSDLRT